jgi:hypothetical protein
MSNQSFGSTEPIRLSSTIDYITFITCIAAALNTDPQFIDPLHLQARVHSSTHARWMPLYGDNGLRMVIIDTLHCKHTSNRTLYVQMSQHIPLVSKSPIFHDVL